MARRVSVRSQPLNTPYKIYMMGYIKTLPNLRKQYILALASTNVRQKWNAWMFIE